MLHFGTGRDILLWTVLKNSQKAISHVQECLGKYGKVPCDLLTVCMLRMALSSQVHRHPPPSRHSTRPHDADSSIGFPLAATAPVLATRLAEKDRNIQSLGHFSRCVSGARRKPPRPTPCSLPTSCSGDPDTALLPHCVGGHSPPGCWQQGSRRRSESSKSSFPGPGCQT